MRKTTVVLAAMLLTAVIGVPGAGAAEDTPFPTAAMEVGSDPQGDWGGGGNAALVGHALGQDLTGAAIRMPDAATVEFTMSVSFLPDGSGSGLDGVPEVTRYVWDLEVDGQFVELDGKFTNYSRGACDPTSGQCPPPRDPGPAPFVIRGDCTADPDTNVTTCQELARVAGSFDPAARTITVAVPSELLGAVECSVISSGANLFGGSISATPSAFFSVSTAPLDFMVVSESFTVPTADPEGC